MKTDFGTEYLNDLLENSAKGVTFGQPIPEEASPPRKKKVRTVKRKKAKKKKKRPK